MVELVLVSALAASKAAGRGPLGTAVLAKPDSTEMDSLQSHSEDYWKDSVPPSLLGSRVSASDWLPVKRPHQPLQTAAPEWQLASSGGSKKLQREKNEQEGHHSFS